MNSSKAGRRRVVVQDAASLTRLCLLLPFYWKLPRIEVRLEALPGLVVQYAQHRITRLTDARNTLLGDVTAIVVLLFGSYAVWWLAQGWRLLGLVAAIALGGWLAGMLVNGTWTRLRLLGLLLHLKIKLAIASGRKVGAIGRRVLAEPRRYQGRRRPWKLLQRFRAAMSRRRQPAAMLPQPKRPQKATRPKVLLRQITDIDRLILKVASGWKLPRVEIPVDAHPSLDVQHAQHLLNRLSQACNCMLGWLFGAATLVGASVYLIWIPNPTLVWARTLGWHSLGWVLALALGAALIGAVIEFIWTRMRLVLLLLWVRPRIDSIAMRA